MQKELLLKVASNEKLRDFITRSQLTRKVVERFVAGESLESAVFAVRRLNETGKRATVDYLGEEVYDAVSTQKPLTEYLTLLDVLQQEKLDANVSLKLSQIGLKFNHNLCRANLERIVDRADQSHNFVRIDMESSSYTQATLDIFYDIFKEHKNVGVVIQAYLYRSCEDVLRLIQKGARVRLCKGAYMEPADAAFPGKREVDLNYKFLMERLLNRGNFPAIATHDPKLIDYAKQFAKTREIKPNRFEFQMLYGIRRDLQEQLTMEGYGMRVYVPFGQQWYPYFTRRLAERPENLLFFLTNLLKR